MVTYSDIGLDNTSPISHYLSEGHLKGYDPSPDFSTDFYINAYPEVKKLNINPLLHYIYIGKKNQFKTSVSKRLIHKQISSLHKHKNHFQLLSKITMSRHPKQHIVFIMNLIQDINILRPLIFLASRDIDAHIEIYISKTFLKKDKHRFWLSEIKKTSDQTGCLVYNVKDNVALQQLLNKKTGLLIAGSESSVKSHINTHDFFIQAPSSFIKMTLQHGIECIGFLHNKRHDMTYGTNINFAADIVAGWFDENKMLSMGKRERFKFRLTGPTSVLQAEQYSSAPLQTGIVCENLHSVRFNLDGNVQQEFIHIFKQFCKRLNKKGRCVTLRPHPAGQYIIKNKIQIPRNVNLSTQPIYRISLSQYAYAISSPSSMIVDLILAKVPVAVWIDKKKMIDAENYQGLHFVSEREEWCSFSKDALYNRQKFIDKQYKYLQKLGFVYERETVSKRYIELLNDSLAKLGKKKKSSHQKYKLRVLLLANSKLPTLQICLLKPLFYLKEQYSLALHILTEDTFLKKRKIKQEEALIELNTLLINFNPTHLVFCRYNGNLSYHLLKWARQNSAKTVFHIDDDLLDIPIELGKKKYIYHNAPVRLKTMRDLLDSVDITYCSTSALKEKLLKYKVKSEIRAGQINCSGKVVSLPSSGDLKKIGYMGFDHDNDFLCCLDGIVKYLHLYPHVTFELFGRISKPQVLEQFSDRIKLLTPIRDYDEFIKTLASRQWDIGICPLAKTPFNELKSNNKWIEYTACGMAVVATKGMIYDESCSKDCGVLVESNEEWFNALCSLTDNITRRRQLILNAQKKLEQEFTIKKHALQLFNILELNIPGKQSISFMESQTR